MHLLTINKHIKTINHAKNKLSLKQIKTKIINIKKILITLTYFQEYKIIKWTEDTLIDCWAWLDNK